MRIFRSMGLRSHVFPQGISQEEDHLIEKALWGSWAIKDKNINIYFSGDTGYGDHFKDIDYGPFDLVLLDTGQYNSAWKYSHMFPFESVRAAKDLNCQFSCPSTGLYTFKTSLG